MDVRVVYGSGLENRRGATHRGFDSLSIRMGFTLWNPLFIWRGAREAEGNGLLNRGRGFLTEGSNPSLSDVKYEIELQE